MTATVPTNIPTEGGTSHAELAQWVAECAELMEKDPAQAERFFGNRVVQGHGLG